MKASTISTPYRDWRDAVDKRLHQIYCISIDDAGFEEEYLISHWQSNEERLILSNGSETNTTLIHYRRLSDL